MTPYQRKYLQGIADKYKGPPPALDKPTITKLIRLQAANEQPKVDDGELLRLIRKNGLPD